MPLIWRQVTANDKGCGELVCGNIWWDETTAESERRKWGNEKFLLSYALWCWPPHARVSLSATLIKHDKGKRPATAAPLSPHKIHTRIKNTRLKTKKKNFKHFSRVFFPPLFKPLFPPSKLPVWAAYCCRVSHWGSWAVPWSARWPFAVLWLKAQHPSWHLGVCQCDAVGTLCAAAEKRRSSAGLSLASASSSYTSFSLLLSLVPRAHAVHRLTGGSTRRRHRFDKCTEQIPIWKLLLGINSCKGKGIKTMFAQVKTAMMIITFQLHNHLKFIKKYIKIYNTAPASIVFDVCIMFFSFAWFWKRKVLLPGVRTSSCFLFDSVTGAFIPETRENL